MIFLYLFRLLCDFSFQFIDMMNYITWFFRRFYLFTFGCGWVFFQLWSAGATLHCGAQAFSLQWLLVTEHGLWVQGLQQLQHAGSVVGSLRALEHWLSCCGTQASLLHGKWDLPGPVVKLISPALHGVLFNHWTTKEAPLFDF